MASRANGRFTIDELADAAGTKVSTVRMYQHRGLLPGPEIEGRVGYYGQAHLQRLHLIHRLQTEGYSLAGIAKLVQAWDSGRGLADLLPDDEPITVSRAEFDSLFPALADDDGLLERLEAMGAVIRDGDRLTLADDRLLRIGSALSDTGIDLAAVVAEAEHTLESTDEIAERFAQLFRNHVWAPYVESGMAPEELPDILEQLNRLQPLAIEAVAASMRKSLRRAGERAMNQVMGELDAKQED